MRRTGENNHAHEGVNYPTPVVLMNMVLTSSPVSDPVQYLTGRLIVEALPQAIVLDFIRDSC